MNDPVAIIQNMEEISNIMNRLKEDYHVDADYLIKGLRSGTNNIDLIFLGCYEFLSAYNVVRQNYLASILYNILKEHTLISALYTVTYLTCNEWIKASYYLTENSPDDLNDENYKLIEAGDCRLWELIDKSGRVDAAKTKQIERSIKSFQQDGFGIIFNTKSIKSGPGYSIYIQNFLPALSFIHTKYIESGVRKPSYIKNIDKKQLEPKEFRRRIRNALCSLNEDYNYLRRKCISNTDDFVSNLLYCYKLERIYGARLLDKYLYGKKFSLQEMLTFYNLPNVFSRIWLLDLYMYGGYAEYLYEDPDNGLENEMPDLLNSVERKMFEQAEEYYRIDSEIAARIPLEDIAYIGNVLVPLYENLFLAVVITLYDGNLKDLKDDLQLCIKEKVIQAGNKKGKIEDPFPYDFKSFEEFYTGVQKNIKLNDWQNKLYDLDPEPLYSCIQVLLSSDHWHTARSFIENKPKPISENVRDDILCQRPANSLYLTDDPCPAPSFDYSEFYCFKDNPAYQFIGRYHHNDGLNRSKLLEHTSAEYLYYKIQKQYQQTR